MKYLSYFPAPLLDDLVKNRWLPILGAGFSRNAETPAGKKMPLWDDLGKILHSELKDFTFTNTLDIVSTYAYVYSRAKLVEKLDAALLIDDAKPSRAHRAFCD